MPADSQPTQPRPDDPAWRALDALGSAFRNSLKDGDPVALARLVANTLSQAGSDQCVIWELSGGGTRMRLVAPESLADGPWEPTSGPVAQVLAANQPIEMGLFTDPLIDDEPLTRFDDVHTVRWFGRFVPIRRTGQIVSVLGALRPVGAPMFTREERIVLDTTAERLEVAYLLHLAQDTAASRSHAGVVHNHGVLLADDLLTRLGAISGDAVFRHLFATGTEFVSDGIEVALGYSPAEVMADPLLLDRLLHPDDRHVLTDIVEDPAICAQPILLRAVRRNGRMAWLLTRLAPILDPSGRVLGVEGILTDVTEMKEAEAELTHQARSDALTGLANRLNFREATGRAIARIERHPGMMGVLFLDLDGFKAVNDTLGHAAGDDVLMQVAERLRRAIRREDLVARLGGDEFAVLLVELRNVNEATATARRILEALEAPMSVNDTRTDISTGVGIAVTSDGTITPDELIHRADVALYQAKRSGRGRWQVYEGPSGSASAAQTVLPLEGVPIVERRQTTGPLLTEGSLRASLAAGDFRVFYLPEVDTVTGRISSVEALVRWQHPEFGLLPASAFINEMGTTEVIHPLGDLVLREACRDVLSWQRRFELPLRLWINVSAAQLTRPGFADTVLATLANIGFAPRDLGLDVPELALDHLGVAGDEAIAVLHRAGVRLAVDDFGLGSASLRTLRRLPLSQIKIDRSLMGDMDDLGSTDDELVQFAIKLAGSLGADVVAVGVERAAQLERLRALQCAFFQGFLAGEAKTADEITSMLAQGQLPLPGLT